MNIDLYEHVREDVHNFSKLGLCDGFTTGFTRRINGVVNIYFFSTILVIYLVIQSISLSVDKSFSQSVSHSIRQSVSQSVSQQVNQSVYLSVCLSVCLYLSLSVGITDSLHYAIAEVIAVNFLHQKSFNSHSLQKHPRLVTM